MHLYFLVDGASGLLVSVSPSLSPHRLRDPCPLSLRRHLAGPASALWGMGDMVMIAAVVLVLRCSEGVRGQPLVFGGLS